MTNFVHCRDCGHQIKETAPTCPKCGAPQATAAQGPPTALAPLASLSSPYGQIPWYRSVGP
jgi:Zn finger protein HypA/HybF involved in hydrogenase expression